MTTAALAEQVSSLNQALRWRTQAKQQKGLLHLQLQKGRSHLQLQKGRSHQQLQKGRSHLQLQLEGLISRPETHPLRREINPARRRFLLEGQLKRASRVT